MGAVEWIGESAENATEWTDVNDAGQTVERDVSIYSKLIITFLCVAPPATGNLAVRIMQSSDFNLRSDAHWTPVIYFDSVDANTPADDLVVTKTITSFHGYIKVQSKCSAADQTVVFNVDIEGKA